MPLETVHFEDFELDRSAYELRRGGSIVHLERIPFDLLNLLVERHGQMVTRQEILEQIWGKDVYVDADNSINTAVRKIRQALHDNPEKPRFVVTIPARGYCFVAPLEKPVAPPAEITRKDVFVDADNGNNTPVRKIRLALKEDPGSPRFLRTVPGKGYRFAPEPLAEKALDAATDGRMGFPGAGSSLLRRQWTLWAALGALAVIGITAVLLGPSVQGWRDRLFVHAAKPRIQSLAVLPLANLSGDPEQEYFADGMTEVLISELGKISSPRVISRQSVMQYKGSKRPLQEIARELNVDAVLEGTVERSGDQVRVIVHLDQVSPEGQLWSNQYNRDIRDVLRVQDEIARGVTDEIQVRLKPQERARLTSSRPVDPEAQDDYFRALHFRNKWEAEFSGKASRTF
jgi:TolB-like protein/DNA-binding winged helix-turn-helix (wHTH) protein